MLEVRVLGNFHFFKIGQNYVVKIVREIKFYVNFHPLSFPVKTTFLLLRTQNL